LALGIIVFIRVAREPIHVGKRCFIETHLIMFLNFGGWTSPYIRTYCSWRHAVDGWGIINNSLLRRKAIVCITQRHKNTHPLHGENGWFSSLVTHINVIRKGCAFALAYIPCRFGTMVCVCIWKLPPCRQPNPSTQVQPRRP
jgi:hypothetical protein